MIAHVAGEVTDKNASSVIVDAGGIGYEIHVTEGDLEQIGSGSSVLLHTYFAVRENAQDLYGFLASDTKRLFELLLGVSGVGPKVALSIVGLGNASQVKSAIASSNIAYIQSANGVGKRGAEKVIVDLKDKVGMIGDESFVLDDMSHGDDALAALIALGYSSSQAIQALSKIDSKKDIESRVKGALAELSK